MRAARSQTDPMAWVSSGWAGRINASSWSSPTSILLGLGGGPVADLLDHRRVGERGRVAELASLGHVTQQAPHDLARAGLGQLVGEDDGLGPRSRADLAGHVAAQLLPQLGGRDAVARHVHDVVDPAQQPDVAVVVDLAAVAGEVAVPEPGPVRLAVALGVAP